MNPDKKEKLFTVNSALIYSAVIPLIIILFHYLFSGVKSEYSQLFIFKPYFLLDRTFGGYVISYLWIFLDFLSIQTLILIGQEAFIFAKAKYDSNKIH